MDTESLHRNRKVERKIGKFYLNPYQNISRKKKKDVCNPKYILIFYEILLVGFVINDL